MIKPGIYKEPSYNQRTFCIEINPPDYIRTWFEEPSGAPQEHWWDVDITPTKFHWLVEQWNKGNIAKCYPHWWEKEDSRKGHINSLLQLDKEELYEVLNYFTYVIQQKNWIGEVSYEEMDHRAMIMVENIKENNYE